MITVEKLEKGTYFDDAFKISFRYDPTTVAKVKELAERRYLPEDRAWEIPAHELPALIEKVGLSNIKSEEAVVQALNTKEIEDKREATQERLKGIKPIRDFDFKTAPLPHQIEAFNYGMEKNSLLIGDEQGLGKTKESIDICVARKKELIKTLIVCGVNSVKYNWEKEIQIHSNEGCVMVDGKTMDVRVQQLNDWYRGSSYFGVINIESLRNEKIQDALYLGIKDGYIGAIIVDEIHKAKNGGSQQGKALRFLKAPVKIGLSGTPMNKAEDLWNILTWLGVERRSFYSFRNAYCTMGGFGGYKVIGYKNLDSLNAELNTVMLRRKKEEVLDLPPKLYSTEYVELTTAQKKQYRDIKNGIVADMENILASVNPLNCTLRLRQLTSGNPNLTDDSPKGACGHEWKTSVKARSNGEKCPICSGARVIAGINDLATLESLLEKQWSEKNKIKSTEVSIGSHKKVIWRCEKGHEWEAAVKSRTINKTGCPYCSHNKVLAGFNDLAMLLPDIATKWSDRNYPLLPTQVTVFANRKAWWKCKDCGRE